MQEALGLRPPSLGGGSGGQKKMLEKHDMAELLRRGRSNEERDDRFVESERITGLGNVYQSTKHGVEREVMEGVGLEADEGAGAEGLGGEEGRSSEPKHRHRSRRHKHRRDEGSRSRHRRSHHRRRKHRERSRSRSRERHDSD
mmetsp:Transcript_1079/g.3184  ORF Transcript_1079/g.3184 Transcript_1079/m.3184 type:complete len:143 (+) Transcript_1079:359-787(+)